MDTKEAQKKLDELMLEAVEICKNNPSISLGFFTYSEEIKTIRGSVVGDPVDVAKSMITACMKNTLLSAVFCGAFAALSDTHKNTPPPSQSESTNSQAG